MTEVNDRSTFCPRCGQHMELSPSKKLQICTFCGWGESTAFHSDKAEAKKEVSEQAKEKEEKQFASRAEERRYNAAQEAKKERNKPYTATQVLKEREEGKSKPSVKKLDD